MKLYEYMAKELFAASGIPVPKGKMFITTEEVFQYVSEQQEACVIKAQVLTGGRGKAGGIKFASTPKEASEAAADLLKMEIKGFPVERLLVEEKIKIDKELYAAITIDGANQKPILIASAQGGMEIEEVPEEYLVKMHLDPEIGIMPFVSREVTRRLGVSGQQAQALQDILTKMWSVFVKYDAELVEINPLVMSGEKALAADGKMTIDDEAAWRLPSLVPKVDDRTEAEKRAHELGISYVELDGDIGVMANGAGITMATLDVLQYYGGAARNFMDAGGGSSMEATAKALEILLSTKPKALLINIFGGITRCDDVANAFAQVKKSTGIPIPVVIRLVGTNQDEGVRILKEIGIEAYQSMDEAAAKVVELAKIAG